MNELLFVLCERDEAASATIRFWAEERVRRGLNKLEDKKIREAICIADLIEQTQAYEKRNPNHNPPFEKTENE